MVEMMSKIFGDLSEILFLLVWVGLFVFLCYDNNMPNINMIMKNTLPPTNQPKMLLAFLLLIVVIIVMMFI
jgi:hypothetical protein